MNSIFNSDNAGEKKLCPYTYKCYRKNPVHFNEMSHPHLEKLIIHQLDEAINIPHDLEFECPDRTQLLDQLKVLQMVLKKERDKNGCSASNSKTNTSASMKKEPQKDKKLDDLKAKIEKHKQAMEEKRQSKLKAMDSEDVICIDDSGPSSANRKRISSTNSDPSVICTYDSGASPANRKRLSSTSNDQSAVKKSRNENTGKKEAKNDSMNSSFSSSDSQGTSSQSSWQSSSSKSSFIDKFVSSTDRKAKEKVRDEAIARMRQAGHVVKLAPPGEFALKYALSAPYHYFFNRVEDSKVTHDQQFTVSFPELLDISLGEIVDSLHINFMVELGWLCLQYLLAAQNAKMTIFCGEVCDPQTSLPANINLIQVKLPTAFGCHHSKVSIFKYSDGGIRIVVSTANLYSDDWENRTQGLWMSPHLPKLPDSANPSDGESPTNFKKSFREYLAAYKNPKLVEWEHLIKKADFSNVNVFFVASVPGSHKGLSLNSWGHRKLAAILNAHAVLPPDGPQWTLVAQASSIGVLGPNYDSWIGSNIVFSMSREKGKGIKSNPNFQFVYPSLRNYENGFDCRVGSCCLPYSRKSHEKQEWLVNYLYQWKSDKTGRTKAMPHVKSYTRISPDRSQIPWFVLTSANLSKGAWGTTAKTGASHYVMNYEAGVVFIPKFVINQTTFPLKESSPEIPIFRLPYDLPLTKYEKGDAPFVSDYLRDR